MISTDVVLVRPLIYETMISPLIHETMISPLFYETMISPLIYETMISPLINETNHHQGGKTVWLVFRILQIFFGYLVKTQIA